MPPRPKRPPESEVPITPGEIRLKVIRARVPAVVHDFEKSCAKEARRAGALIPKEDPKLTEAELIVETITALAWKRRRSHYAYGNTGAGDCYEAALITLAGYVDRTLVVRLVHGYITNQKGVQQGHGWIEVGEGDGVIVVDPSNHRDRTLIASRAVYYRENQVPEDDTLRRYTLDDVVRENRRSMTYGPWHGPNAT